MPARFALRIESGEQAGETHAIGGGGLTVGRRPGNDLVIRDASVSGRHARFSLEGDEVVLVDFGSTNGSFVADERVDQAHLQAGAFLRLGAIEIELVLLDSLPSPSVPAARPPKANPQPVADEIEIQLEGMDDESVDLDIEGLAEATADGFDDDDDGVHRIDGAALAAAKGGPGRLPFVVGALLVAGAGAWYFLGMPGIGGGGSDGPVRRAPGVVAGNLLKDASFESKAGVTVVSGTEDPEVVSTAAWIAEETAALTPFVSEAWRFGGEVALGADLDVGEATRARSAAVVVGRARQLEALATAFAEGGGVARLGIELFDAAGEHPAFVAWSAAARELSGEQARLSVQAPSGYDRARLVLDFSTGAEPGSVGFDDVSLVATSGSPGAVVFGDFSVLPMGPEHLALGFLDRPLLVDMVGGAPKAGTRGVTFSIAPGGRFGATLDPALLAEGLATLGANGYQPHGDAFEDEGVTSVVIGSGVHQLRLVFPTSVTLTGRPALLGYRIEAPLAAGELSLELGFSEERARAARLDSQAHTAEKKGQRGEALALWQRLLDEVPFDGELVLAAEANRGRLIAAGLAGVDELAGDFGRATFFGLPDLFRDCLDGVVALETEFRGSEVFPAAQALHAEVLAALEASGGLDPRALRLREARRAVLELTRESGGERLADHIQAALEGGATQEGN